MIKINISLDSKAQLDLLMVAIEHLRADDFAMSKALASNGEYGDAKKLKARGEDLDALKTVIFG
jgi:hypothetical protein